MQRLKFVESTKAFNVNITTFMRRGIIDREPFLVSSLKLVCSFVGAVGMRMRFKTTLWLTLFDHLTL